MSTPERGTFKVLSWNVAGIARWALDIFLINLDKDHDWHILLLQEF